jgi:hypothetical protein
MKSIKQIKQFLESGIFSSSENNFGALATKLEKLAESKDPIKIVYGETYDQFGLTLDSLKYYFVLHIFHELINENVSKCTIIIGDIASLRNQNSLESENAIKDEIKNNITIINSIIKKFDLNIEPVLMSQIFTESSFETNLQSVTAQYQQSGDIKNLFEKTVLENRLKQEQETDFLYSREEVAIIMNYDIKVGPPREKYYDQVASKVKSSLSKSDLQGIYVSPTYPLGFNFDYFICNPEIEKYGVTPYKAGSNKLQDHRIILKDIKPDIIKNLIDNSFLPKDPILPNPLLDLYIIADLAKRVIDKDYDFSNYTLKDFNKEELFPLLNKYLFSKL